MICEIAENGRTRTAFRYEHEYLERNDAFALDPVSLLLSAGSSPGGARPKAVVFDAGRDTHYLAKFPSTRDQKG